jgi:Ca2+-binding EF-hand superfamily protein
MADQQSIYQQTFEEYDKDKSGFIDKTELGALLKTLFSKSGITLDESATAYYL